MLGVQGQQTTLNWNRADIFYVARRLTDSVCARQAIPVCLDAFEIAVEDRSVLERAQVLAGADFEDHVQIACAELNQLDAIVTRAPDDYAGSPIPAWSPAFAGSICQAPANSGNRPALGSRFNSGFIFYRPQRVTVNYPSCLFCTPIGCPPTLAVFSNHN